MNREYTPGGSTGGESALLYLNGSILGWGTDIGGSIRIPCQMMGLYGLKPSVRLNSFFFANNLLTLPRAHACRIPVSQFQQKGRNMSTPRLARLLVRYLQSTRS